MRGQSLEGLLEYEAKRKPEIKALLDRVDDLTDADIESAVVPLPWFRQALKQIRDRRAAERRNGGALEKVVYGVNPEPLGRVFYWNQETIFIQTSNIATIELNYQELYFLPDTGGLCLGYSTFKLQDPRLEQGVLEAEGQTRSQYLQAYQYHLQKRF